MSSENKAKVAFVEPAGSYSNVFSRYMTIPMLGPLYLATIAEQAGYDVSILNENLLGRKIRHDELVEVDILCVSCMTATVDRGREIARTYKAVRKGINLDSRTVIGGIHASMLPEDVVNDFDQVFVGEAETKILDILDGKITDPIVYGERMENLDLIPHPNFRLLQNWEKMKFWPVATSRGCPYDCTFCSVTEMFGRRYRTRSVKNVMEEVQRFGKSWIFFVDDHFVVNKGRTKRLLRELKSNRVPVSWSCQLRAEIGRDSALVAQMRDAGCQTVFIGFESISSSSLREIKKNQTVDDITYSIKTFRNNRINVHGMFMFGSDSENREIFEATSRFCTRSGLASVQYLILTPLPGTAFYRKIEEEGRLLHKNWQYYDAMHVVFRPKNFTAAELQQGMIDCFSDFYSYANAFNDAINIFFTTGYTFITALWKKVYFPSITSFVIKLLGKRIVKNWVEFNRPYLGYLNILSHNPEKRMDEEWTSP
jgi:radical SAM superfamily enzyme YgiQ (UPF0313 family)